MKTWTVSIDMAFSAPPERSNMEDALEEYLSALMSSSEIEGPAGGLNAESHIIMTIVGVEAHDYAEALQAGVMQVQRAARSAGFAIQAIERVEVAAANELVTTG